MPSKQAILQFKLAGSQPAAFLLGGGEGVSSHGGPPCLDTSDPMNRKGRLLSHVPFPPNFHFLFVGQGAVSLLSAVACHQRAACSKGGGSSDHPTPDYAGGGDTPPP